MSMFKRTLPLTLLLLLLVGCGDEAPAQTEPEAETVPAATEAAKGSALPASEAASTAPLPLTFADLDPAETIPVGDLHAAYFAWKNQPISFGGYLWSRTSRGKINKTIGITGEPGGETNLAGCRLPNPSGESVKSDVPLVIKGRYTHFTTATLDDCIRSSLHFSTADLSKQ